MPVCILIRKVITMLAFLLPVLLMGCITTHPLHISDQAWLAMSSAEQLRAYEKQADLDRMHLKLRLEEKRAETALQLKKQQQLAVLKQNGGYGDLVECILEPLKVRYSRKWKKSLPVAFSLVRGELKRLDFQDEKARYRTTGWVRFHEDGQVISICQYHSKHSGANECADLLGTTKEFHRGIKKMIQVDKLLRGQLRCDLKPINSLRIR